MKNLDTKFPKRALSVLMASATTLALIGCGGTGQDDQTPSTSSTQFSGVAIDGALARATVYLDSNNNATRDPWEDYAFTDNDGYYSYNPKTNTDYCASSAPASEKIYCLKSSRSFSNVVVRVDGGYDLLTGEPFLGQMSRRVELEESTSSVDSVVSPLTTLLTNVESSNDRSNLLNALRISENDLDINYLDSDGMGSVNSGLLNTALKVHKTVTILSDRLNDNYEELGDEVGTMNDPSSEVYRNLAQELTASSNTGLDNILQDTQALTRIMDNSERVLRDLYQQKELNLPEDLGSSESPNQLSRVVNIASNIPNIVNRLIDPISTIDTSGAQGSARALETFVIKSVNEGRNDDPSIDNAVDFFTNEANTTLVDALTSALSGERGDLSALVSNDFSGSDFDSEEEINQASRLDDSAQPLSLLAGRTLKVSELDLGSAPNNLKDSEVEFYFTGDTDAISGQFTSCVKFIDGASTDGTLGEGNSRGELVNGYWSMLGASSDNRSSFSVLLTIEFLGATYQAILKPNGTATIANTEYERIRFDFDGEIKNWYSVDGLTTTEVAPTSNTDCETRLPSRVGI
ncbi:hypothetical protein [Saccharophagus degradans]|uniref:Uncharacterized protein n=1 Tax=Saccharophagus degradans TaxID=86304 RepID=A0AAW7X4L2_9GAMM|nr:hypothetical protein [Saccharophagus degradans]MDO6421913.1 hypothetical protein [Saccharophagus degradans]MDO6606394.1 hypothetical protein [Saccharophagus degradans]